MAIDFDALDAEEEKRAKSVAPLPVQESARLPEEGAPSPVMSAGPSITDETSDDPGVMQDILVRGVAGGAEAAVKGAFGTGRELLNQLPGVDIPDYMQEIPDIAKPKHMYSQIVKDITQFGIGFAVGGSYLKGAKIAMGGIKQAVAAGGIGDAIVSDPHEHRLANTVNDFAKDHPWAENVITEYLAAKDSDSVAEGKLKAGIEGVITGAAAEVLFKGVKSLWHMRKGDPEAAAKAAEGIEDAILRAEKQAETGPEHISKVDGEVIELDEIVVKANDPITDVEKALVRPEASAVEKVAADKMAEIQPAERVYHGTPNSFEEFDPSKMGGGTYGPGFYFTNSGEAASKHAGGHSVDGKKIDGSPLAEGELAPQVRVHTLDVKKPFDMEKPVDADIVMPFVAKLEGNSKVDPVQLAKLQQSENNGDLWVNLLAILKSPDKVNKAIKGFGYDGIVDKHVDGTKEWVVFKKEQIRSGFNSSENNALKQKISKGADLVDEMPAEKRGKLAEEMAKGDPNATYSITKTKDGEFIAYRNSVKVVEAKNAKGEAMFSMTAEQHVKFQEAVKIAVAKGDTQDLFRATDGLFNYSTWDSSMSVERVVTTLTDMIRPQLDAKMGAVRTLNETNAMALAKITGQNLPALIANMRTYTKNIEDIDSMIVAGKMLIQSLARDTKILSDKYLAGTATAFDHLEMVRLSDIMADVVGMTSTMQKSTARATNAGKLRTAGIPTSTEIRALTDEAGGPEGIRKLAERLSLTGGDAEKMAKLVKESKWKKFLDSHHEFWINAVLSGVKTHMVNITTATMQNMLKPAELILGGTVQGVFKNDWTNVAHGIEIYRGLRTVLFDSMEMTRRAWASNQAVLDPSKGTIERGSVTSISAANYNLNPDAYFSKFIDGLGGTVRMASRFLTAEDEFFKQMAYRGKLNAQATAEALAEVKAGRLDMNAKVKVEEDGAIKEISAFDKFIQDRFDAGFTYQERKFDWMEKIGGGSSMVRGEKQTGEGTLLAQTMGNDKNALQYSREGTFTQDLKAETWMGERSFSEWLQDGANTFPIFKSFVMPFIKVPSNLMRETWNHTPGLNLMRAQYVADLKAGGERQAAALGKMVTGGGFWMTAGFLAHEGTITGGSFGDKTMRDKQLESGWQPYSFVVTNDDGTKTYIPFNRFDPFASFLGIAADFANLSGHMDEQTKTSFAVAMTLSLAGNVTSKSYLKGLVDVMGLLGSGYNKAEVGERWIQGRLGSYMPSIASIGNPDTEMKELRGMLDGFMAKTPGWSNSIEAKRDYFGDKRMSPMGYPWNAILPSQPSTSSGVAELTEKGTYLDPRMELARLAQSDVKARFDRPDTKVGNLDLTQIKNSEGQSAYDRWMELHAEHEIGGRTFHDAMKDLLASDKYQDANDGTAMYNVGKRRVEIEKLATKYHDATLNVVEREFNLRGDVRQDKKNEKAVRRGKEASPLDILNTLQ